MFFVKNLKDDNVAFFSDVHGSMEALHALEKTPVFKDPEVTLVFLGDAIDGYGSNVDSKGVSTWLINHPEVIWVAGNHDMFLFGTAMGNRNAFDDWMLNGGKQTLRNLGYYHSTANFTRVKTFLNKNYPDVINRIAESYTAVGTPSVIGVHAGVDLTLPDWHDTSEFTSQWVREPYYNNPNTTGKVIVSGHTPVLVFQKSPKAIELTDGNANRYLIDGGLSSGSSETALNVLHDNNGEITINTIYFKKGENNDTNNY